jgi:hypothetical protein
LNLDDAPIINNPSCQNYFVGIRLNGNDGTLKWAKPLAIDTVVSTPNCSPRENGRQSILLDNGNTFYYYSQSLDTNISYPFSPYPVNLVNKFYLFDSTGNLIQSKSTGTIINGWPLYEFIRKGENNEYYGAEIFNKPTQATDQTSIFQIRKISAALDTLETTRFVLQYPQYYPAATPVSFDYRNHVFTTDVALESQGIGPDNYAYFGTDSFYTFINAPILTRLVDSTNFVEGHIYLDINKNNIRDTN